MPDDPRDPAQYMTCMEVWGGNQPADHSVTMPGLDAWVFSRPFEAADAGGDVYYVSACATGRITRLLLADVSGHGTHVADTAAGLRRLMQKYVNYIDQSSFVRSMNQRFAELTGAGVFATAIVSTFFAPTNDLTLCVAGHPPPMRYRIATREWKILSDEAGNIPLGIDDITEWAQFGIQLQVGDLVLAYTDSLIESRGADGEMLGVEGLLKILRSIPVHDPKQLTADLLKAVGAAAPGNLTADDVTVLLFRPNGSVPGVSIKDKIFAPLRVIRGVIESLLPNSAPAPFPEFSIANLGGILFKPLNRFWTRRNAALARKRPPLSEAQTDPLRR